MSEFKKKWVACVTAYLWVHNFVRGQHQRDCKEFSDDTYLSKDRLSSGISVTDRALVRGYTNSSIAVALCDSEIHGAYSCSNFILESLEGEQDRSSISIFFSHTLDSVSFQCNLAQKRNLTNVEILGFLADSEVLRTEVKSGTHTNFKNYYISVQIDTPKIRSAKGFVSTSSL